MTLRKITIDKTVRYVSNIDNLHSEQTQPFSKEREKASNKKLLQNNERFIEKKQQKD